MKLTKFTHACVLVEDGEHTVLFDPGEFAWKSGLVDLEKIAQLDYVLISHEHFDHFNEPFVQAIIAKFPSAQFFSTPEVVEKLRGMGALQTSTESNEHVTIDELAHDGMSPLAPSPPCQNVRFHYKNRISHPGDSIHMTESQDILFLPLAGPWEATIDAIAWADSLPAKYIVPIHDWMWRDEWRNQMYERLEQFFAGKETTFIKPIDGQSFVID